MTGHALDPQSGQQSVAVVALLVLTVAIAILNWLPELSNSGSFPGKAEGSSRSSAR
jgi:hypothetical protein